MRFICDFYKNYWRYMFYLFVSTACADIPQAVVIVPVADVVYEQLGTHVPDAAAAYAELPYAEASLVQEQEWCERGYQLLFNETVGVLREEGDEVLVSVPHIFYKCYRDSKPQTTYWMLKKNIKRYCDFQEKGIVTSYFPQPIQVDMYDLAACNHNTVSLILPWYDPVTQEVYSAGTRFIYTHYAQGQYNVTLYDAHRDMIVNSSIPETNAVCYQEKNIDDRIADFVALIRYWAHISSGIIPYVWGGASFTHVLAQNNFSTKQVTHSGRVKTIFIQHDMSCIPYTGFDCSCMISRAAQLCGIPYFLGNSATIEYMLPTITQQEYIREGDIIWFPGHVVVISSITDHTIVEARGYGSGFGCIHELPLQEFFKGIETVDQLREAYFQQKPLTLLNSKGQDRMTVSHYKICKLRGIVSVNL